MSLFFILKLPFLERQKGDRKEGIKRQKERERGGGMEEGWREGRKGGMEEWRNGGRVRAEGQGDAWTHMEKGGGLGWLSITCLEPDLFLFPGLSSFVCILSKLASLGHLPGCSSVSDLPWG